MVIDASSISGKVSSGFTLDHGISGILASGRLCYRDIAIYSSQVCNADRADGTVFLSRAAGSLSRPVLKTVRKNDIWCRKRPEIRLNLKPAYLRDEPLVIDRLLTRDIF